MSDWQLISVFKGIIKSLIMIDRSHDLLLHADWSICTTWPKSGFLIGRAQGGPSYYFALEFRDSLLIAFNIMNPFKKVYICIPDLPLTANQII